MACVANAPGSKSSSSSSSSDAEVDLDFILEDLPKIIASMHSGSARIREIVGSLRNFSRVDESGIKRTDIHSGIDSTLVVLGHQLAASSKHPKIEIVKDYGDIPQVECDPAQINQVMLAILANAIYSVKAACQKDETSTFHSEQLPQIRISTTTDQANQVVIRIQDNGMGIEEEHRSKVFDHFFTTKPVGAGTGLGLATAYQTIKQHHGTIQLHSDGKTGTEFTIELPVGNVLPAPSSAASQERFTACRDLSSLTLD